MRAQAAVNSPKGDNGMTFGDDNDENNNENGMSLNLGDDINDDEDDYDPNNATPNTKMRVQADVNSPRAKTKQKWGDDSSAAVAGLVTQVDRPPSNGGGGGAPPNFITQVERPGDNTEKDIKDA